jgi:transposase
MPAWWTERRVVRDGDKVNELPALSAGLAQWRSPRKLQRLADVWKKDEHRFDGDGEMLEALLAWAKHDRHLGQWEAHMRDRTLAHRKEVWRQVAADLARTYQTILVEDGLCRSEGRQRQMKLPDIEGWERPEPEDGDPHEGREQRRQSRMAAPGELRLAISHASHKTASTVVDVSRTKNSTRECAWCGHVQKDVDFAATIEIQCEDCARTWDQDANAGRNLLHRRGLSSGPVPPVPVTSGPVPPVDGKALAQGKRAKLYRNAGSKARRAAKEMTL